MEDKAHRFRRTTGERPLVYGHRGARTRAPENTLEAFQLAVDEGADGVELDVRMTSDGALVVTHDPAVQLSDGARLAVHSLTESQLRSLRLPSGLPIPTLSHVLNWQRASGALLNVELKGDVPHPRWMAEEACRQVAEAGADDCVLFSSFHPIQVRTTARRMPNIPSALLIDERASSDGAISLLAHYRHLGAVGVHPHHTWLDRIVDLKARGALVNCWTVNDAELARRLAQTGLDGIVTDSPREVLAALG